MNVMKLKVIIIIACPIMAQRYARQKKDKKYIVNANAHIYIYVCVCVCLNCRFASSFSSIAIHDSTPDLSSAFKVYGAIGSSIGNRGIDGTLQKLYTLHYARPSLFLYPYTFNSTFALCLQDQMYSQYACPLETFAFTTITHPIKQEEFPQ